LTEQPEHFDEQSLLSDVAPGTGKFADPTIAATWNLQPRPGESWIRREDAANLDDNKRVTLQVHCDKCGEYRVSFYRRTANNWFDRPVTITSTHNNAQCEADLHGKVHIHCTIAGCEQTDEQISASTIETILAKLCATVGRNGQMTVRWDQVCGRY
jgi:hypothetical protein